MVKELPTLLPIMITQLPNKKVDDTTKAKLTEILKGTITTHESIIVMLLFQIKEFFCYNFIAN